MTTPPIRCRVPLHLAELAALIPDGLRLLLGRGEWPTVEPTETRFIRVRLDPKAQDYFDALRGVHPEKSAAAIISAALAVAGRSKLAPLPQD